MIIGMRCSFVHNSVLGSHEKNCYLLPYSGETIKKRYILLFFVDLFILCK